MAFNRTLQHFTSSQELATQWASGQSYILDQLVLESDKLYRCILAHTSGATFAGDSANWVGINPGQTISIADGGTGQTTQTAAFDALAPTTTAGDLIVHNGTDNVRQGIGTDGQVLVVDTAQTNKLKWATIQQGSKNYIANSTFENGVTPPSSWSTFSTTIDSTTKIPSGSVTPDPTITLATSLSTPLAGTYSMLASSGAVTITTTGYGFISSAFTIDREDQAKAMGFSFYYEAASGTMNFSGTSSNTFAVYIRDVSGGAWIQPAGVYNLVQSSGVGLCSGTFQTTASGTQYQIAVLMINTVSAGVSMRFDDFRLGPQSTVQGAAISDWVSYTPVVTPTSGSVTNATVTGKYRRVGDTIEIQGSIAFSGLSAAFSEINVSYPSGLSFDISKLTATQPFRGFARARFPGASRFYLGNAFPLTSDPTKFRVMTQVVNTADAGSTADAVFELPITNTFPSTFNTGDTLDFQVSAPIQGWSSNTVMSQDTDTRVVAFIGTTIATSIPTGTYETPKIIAPVLARDTHGAYNQGSGVYTTPISGFYEIEHENVMLVEPGKGFRVGFTINSTTSYARASNSDNASTTLSYGLTPTVKATVYLNAGDLIRFAVSHTNAASTNLTNDGRFQVYSIKRISGPATIAASESVVAHYRRSLSDGNQTLSSASSVVYFTGYYPSKVVDTHNFVTSSASDTYATIPVSGVYEIVLMNRVDTSTVTETFQHFIMLGGTNQTGTLTIDGTQLSAGITPTDTVGRTCTVVYSGRFNAGDIIRFKVLRYAAVTSVLIGNNFCGFTIKRVGN